MVDTQVQTQVLSCAPPTRSYSEKVSSETCTVHGSDRLGSEGNVLGSYTGTRRTTVVDAYVKGRSTRVRTTRTVLSKTYSNLTFDPQVTKRLLYSMDYRLKRAWEEVGFAIHVDGDYGPSVAFLPEEGGLYVGCEARFDDILYTMGYFSSFVCGNLNQSSTWLSIWQAEKGRIQGAYSSRAALSPQEMYCVAFYNLCRRPSPLRRNTPQTYTCLYNAPGRITQARLSYLRRYLARQAR